MRMGKTKRIIAAILLASVLCSSTIGCVQNNRRPENTINKLQDAINNLDLDVFLDCIDSKWSNQVKAICDFTAVEGGPSVGSLISFVKVVVPVLPFMSGGTIYSEDFPQVNFVILHTDISGDTAIVGLSGLLTCGECHKPFAATVEMQLENDVWVISGIR